MFDGIKPAWHDYIGDAPVDDLYQAKLAAFLAGWEACVARQLNSAEFEDGSEDEDGQ